MPARQIASIQSFPIAAPAAIATALQFAVKRSGKLDLVFENDQGDGNVTVSVEVSADGSSWNATTAANNLSAITSVAVAPKTNKTYTLLLRAGIDLYVRVRALGGVMANLQVRGEADIERTVIV